MDFVVHLICEDQPVIRFIYTKFDSTERVCLMRGPEMRHQFVCSLEPTFAIKEAALDFYLFPKAYTIQDKLTLY